MSLPMPPRIPRNFDPDNLVGHAEIARRLRVEIDTVHKWRQRYSDFPAPFVELKMGPVFWWPEVDQWHRERYAGGAPQTTRSAR